jgi:pleiotropic regulator 1
VQYRHQQGFAASGGQASSKLSQALMRKKEAREVKPQYHAPCRSLCLLQHSG